MKRFQFLRSHINEMNLGIINDHEIILSPNLENGTHLSLRTYRFRDLGDRTYQGHHWS